MNDVKLIIYVLSESIAARLRAHGLKCTTVAITIRDKELYICVLQLSSLPVGFCSETYIVTEQQPTTLENNLTQLKENNNQLQNLLNQSNQELQTASEQSENLNDQIAQLNQQLQESQNQITTLKQQLIALKEQTTATQQSLQIANQELANASQSFKAYEKKQERIQSKLKTQKNIWKAIAIVSLGYAIAK